MHARLSPLRIRTSETPGTNQADFESARVWSEGLVIRDLPLRSSNRREDATLTEFLATQQVVSIADIDTRKLTRHIRECGAMGGCISAGTDVSESDAVNRAIQFPGLTGMDLAKVVTQTRYVNLEGRQLV